LAEAGENHVLVINPVVYSEVSTGFDRIEDLDEALSSELFRRDPLPWDATFLAGKAFREYRKRGGARRSPLPGFYIGAHAAVAGLELLTRDVARYRTAFPRLRLICPEG
jgi:predicted nucleic acid-binding protein